MLDFRVDYDDLERVITALRQCYDESTTVESAVRSKSNELFAGAWRGKGAAAFQEEMEAVLLPSLGRLTAALEMAAGLVFVIHQFIHECETDAANVFNGRDDTVWGGGGFRDLGRGAVRSGVAGRSWLEYHGFPRSMFPNLSETRLFGGPEERRWSDYVELRVPLWEREFLNIGDSAWSDSVTGSLGTLRGSALGYDASLTGEAYIGTDGFAAELEGRASAYLLKGEYNTQVAGVDVAVNGLAGAEARGEFTAAFNPLAGDVRLKAEGDVFIGLRGQGEASATFFNFLEVTAQGELSAGAGARGVIDFGIDEDTGKWQFEAFGSATWGVGGGGGVRVELDPVEAGRGLLNLADDAIDTGRQVLDGANTLLDFADRGIDFLRGAF